MSRVSCARKARELVLQGKGSKHATPKARELVLQGKGSKHATPNPKPNPINSKVGS